MSRNVLLAQKKGGFLLVEVLCAFFVLMSVSAAVMMWYGHCCARFEAAQGRLKMIMHVQQMLEHARVTGKVPAGKHVADGVTSQATMSSDGEVEGFRHVIVDVSIAGKQSMRIKTGFIEN